METTLQVINVQRALCGFARRELKNVIFPAVFTSLRIDVRKNRSYTKIRIHSRKELFPTVIQQLYIYITTGISKSSVRIKEYDCVVRLKLLFKITLRRLMDYIIEYAVTIVLRRRFMIFAPYELRSNSSYRRGRTRATSYHEFFSCTDPAAFE